MNDSGLIIKDVLRTVGATIQEHALLKAGDRVVVAVSGGPDSVALLHILLQLSPSLRWQLAVAHLHHGLRGKDADDDLEFVRALANNLSLESFCHKLPAGYLKKMRGSLQDAARRERYKVLEALRVKWKGHKIALGHQADDQAETVLAALLRGSGTHGLSGMPYERGGTLVRPLLDLTRHEIIQYLEARSIPFRLDPSNKDLSYKRNQIRHELLPLLRQRFNPRVGERLRRTASICSAEDSFMAAQTDALWQEIAIPCLDQVKIPLEHYRGSPKALRYRLLRKAYRHLRNDTGWPTMVQLDALDRAAHAAREEKWLYLPGGIRGVVGGGKLVMGRVESLMPGHLYYHVSFPGETEIRESDLRIRWEILEDRLPKGWLYHRDVVYMDVRAIRGELTLRGPARGDRLRPLGLGGTKKVQDILVDRHIPRRERWRVPLLVDEAGILWVVGHCLDERIKIKPNTREILKATLQHLGQPAE